MQQQNWRILATDCTQAWQTRLLQGKAEPQNDDELEALRKPIAELQDPPKK